MYHIIVNPASRSGKGIRLWEDLIVPCLAEQNIKYTAHFSKKMGDVARLAAEITKDAGPDNPVNLIFFGGDGTFNEALQGISDFRYVTIGYVPTGSSNDLARDLGISKDPASAFRQIFTSGRLHTMDLGEAILSDGTIRRFAVSCGIGFDAAVCEEVNRSAFKRVLNKIGLGKLAYLGIAVKNLFTAPSSTCKVLLDDKQEIELKDFIFLAAMNHRYEGGGFKFCPKANYCDGIMDVCTAAGISRLLILFALPTAFFGKHYMFKGIYGYTGCNMNIQASIPLWVHTDGEVIGQTDNLKITCRKQAIRIIY